ncbi:hypothetical protein MST27_10640 [Pseudomonas sp. PS1]|uniref:Uncharacterized protein n=1 Tax=Stutzerimonas marianensis TaxID=2929513 RepID=A0A9X1W357_9GAMM|nr:hypothetical protein [Pseudomonas marianensis]MCJ0973827.1 hypothetical protein [Pseudomonas marianensis]
MVTLGFGLVASVANRVPFSNHDRTKLMAMSICADCIIGLSIALAIIIAA